MDDTNTSDKKQTGEERLETLLTFLREDMPTKQEMQEMEQRMANKEDVNAVLTAVDAYAKQSKDYYQEVTVVVAKVNRIERWIREVAAPKLGVPYDTTA